MSFTFNPFIGNLDKTLNATELAAIADLLYLKLDCSNDPLTGALNISGYLGIGTTPTYPLHLVRTSVPAGKDYALYADWQCAAQTDVLQIGFSGFVKNTSNNTAGTGHLVGVFGEAQDTATGKHFLIGAEGYTTGKNTSDSNTYYGLYGHGRFVGTTMPITSAVYGMGCMANVLALDEATPVAEGLAAGIAIQNGVGGLLRYGILIYDQTGGVVDIGLAIQGADTYTLWLGAGADNTDAANGIFFGASADTNLYRGAANQLKTDDTLLLGDKLILTQTDGNEYIDSLNDGYLDLGATTGIRLLQNTFLGSNSAGMNETIYETLGAELAPALTTGNWTLGTGWSYLTSPNRLQKLADTAGTAAPTTPLTISAGVVYKVVIVVDSAGTTGCYYTLGAVYGSHLKAAGTYTDYITASTTGNLLISAPTNAGSIVISSLSIKAVTDATGDLTVGGNLNAFDGAYFGDISMGGKFTVKHPSIVMGDISGNTRAYHTIDIQLEHSDVTNVAAGLYSVCIGINNETGAQAQSSVCLGAGNETPSANNTLVGTVNLSNTGASSALGYNNKLDQTYGQGYVTVLGVDNTVNSGDYGWSGAIGWFNEVYGGLCWAIGVGVGQSGLGETPWNIDNSIAIGLMDVGLGQGNVYFPYGKTRFGGRTAPSAVVDITGDLAVSTTSVLGGNVTIGLGASGIDYTLTFNGETNDLILTWMEDEDYLKTDALIRTSISLYRRYYHLPISAFDPGLSGGTWTAQTANNLNGYQLNAATEILYFQADIHSDWDGASDITVEIKWQILTAGSNNDTVDLKLVCRYMGVGDAVTKTQTQEVATTTTGTQYKMYKTTFTINWDESSNVVDAGDSISFALNLETDTSEIDNILIVDGSFSYLTTHIGIESGDS